MGRKSKYLLVIKTQTEKLRLKKIKLIKITGKDMVCSGGKVNIHGDFQPQEFEGNRKTNLKYTTHCLKQLKV